MIISRYKFPYETTVGVFFFFVAQLRPLHLTAMVLLARPGGFSTNHWGGKGGEKFALRGYLYHEHPKPMEK